MKHRNSDTGETSLWCRFFFLLLLWEANAYVPEMTRKYAEIGKNFFLVRCFAFGNKVNTGILSKYGRYGRKYHKKV